MKFLKKWGTLIVAVVLLLVIAILVLVGMKSIKEYKSVIEDQQASIDNMSSFIDNDIGPLVDCYVVNKQVRVGDTVEDELLVPVQIPEKIAYSDREIQVEVTDEDGKVSYETQIEKSLTVVTNKNDILGKKFRVDLGEGALVLADFIVDETIANDERLYQIILENYPTDLKLYDYIDIRILMTYGQDFIAIPHKRVEGMDLENGIFTFVFNENEINVYNSMLLDKAMYENVSIYALRYLDNVSQIAAEGYYPVNTNISEILSINPNILNLVKKEMVLERDQLNSLMGGNLDEFDDRALSQVNNEIRQYRNQVNSSLHSAIRQRIRDEEEAARLASMG